MPADNPDFLLTPATVPTLLQRNALRLLQWMGWHVHFKPLPGPRGVIIVYPHTSNWDFVVGLLAKWAVGIQVRWLGKETLFTGAGGFFLGGLLRRLGGQPVVRGASTGAIERLAQSMQAADWYWLALAPEGTREYRPGWRSGFYHIAREAGVPIAVAYIDYATRIVGVIDHIEPSGDLDGDMQKIRAAYAGRQGLHPELASPIVVPPPPK
jgi:1-acyl-sn-glycerol-3-phosphate acyltransferase